jgi:type I restriction enzyme M protein
MITGEIKSKVDRIWDTLWSGGISNPLTIIEQLTYLLFIKRLDELHTLKENKAARLKAPIEEPIFTPAQDQLRWSRFKETSPEQMFATVRDHAFAFIKTIGQSSSGEGSSTYSHHMKDATFMMPTPRVLANVVDQLDQSFFDLCLLIGDESCLHVPGAAERLREPVAQCRHALIFVDATGGTV